MKQNTDSCIGRAACWGLTTSLSLATLPAVPGCVSSQKDYVGRSLLTVQGQDFELNYTEKHALLDLPLSGRLEVDCPDGTKVVYHDWNCDGCVDGKDTYVPAAAPASQPEMNLSSSRRWFRLSRMNPLSPFADVLELETRNTELQKAQKEYEDWLTRHGGVCKP